MEPKFRSDDTKQPQLISPVRKTQHCSNRPAPSTQPLQKRKPSLTTKFKRQRKRRPADDMTQVTPPHLRPKKPKPPHRKRDPPTAQRGKHTEPPPPPEKVQKLQQRAAQDSWDDSIGRPWHEMPSRPRTQPAAAAAQSSKCKRLDKEVCDGAQLEKSPIGKPLRHAKRWPSKANFPEPRRARSWQTKWSVSSQRMTNESMADWDGTWAYPCIERAMASVEQIRTWCEDVASALNSPVQTMPMKFDLAASKASSQELVPRYWLPIVIDGKSPTTFWKQHVASRAPSTLDAVDLDGVTPWWERLPKDCFMLEALPAPQILGIDPDESPAEKRAREQDFGSDKHAKQRVNKERVRRGLQQKRKHKYEEEQKRNAAATHDGNATLDSRRGIVTGIELVIRAVRFADIAMLQSIYNHYVSSACQAPEIEPLTYEEVRQLVCVAQSKNLPFLVAFRPGEVHAPVRGKHLTAYDVSAMVRDNIVGFAFAEDFGDTINNQYGSTVQLQVYTGPEHTRQRIATCLVDKIVSILDRSYDQRSGYKSDGNNSCAYARKVDNILVQLPYANAHEMHWTWMWLAKWFAFEKTGNLKDIGMKLGRKVSLAILQRKNGIRIDGQEKLSD